MIQKPVLMVIWRLSKPKRYLEMLSQKGLNDTKGEEAFLITLDECCTSLIYSSRDERQLIFSGDAKQNSLLHGNQEESFQRC